MNIDKLMKRDRGSDEIWVNEFTEESARDFREAVIEASRMDSVRPIIVYIDSYGGIVDSLATMIETMDSVPNPFITVAVGKAMSCGAILLSHGDVRFCGQYSRIMIHEVSGGVSHGDVHDQHADAIEVKRLNKQFMGLLAKNCNIKGGYDGLRKMIKNQDGRDHYMNAEQALKFGVVDGVGMPKIEKVKIYQVNVLPEKSRLKNKANKRAKNRKPDTKR